MVSRKLTMVLRGVGNDIPTRVGKSRPTLTYVSYLGNRYSVPYRYAGRDAILELQGDHMTVRVGTEVICSHTLVPGHARTVREKDHFKGLLSQAMACNAGSSRKPPTLFRIVSPEVEHRSLAVYDTFSNEVGS